MAIILKITFQNGNVQEHAKDTIPNIHKTPTASGHHSESGNHSIISAEYNASPAVSKINSAEDIESPEQFRDLSEDPKVKANVEDDLKQIWMNIVSGTQRHVVILQEAIRPLLHNSSKIGSLSLNRQYSVSLPTQDVKLGRGYILESSSKPDGGIC